MNIGMSILLELDPLVSYNRTTGALNVVGASSSASRSSLETVAGNKYYINNATGNDTTGDGSAGNPWATITKFNLSGGSRTGEIQNAATYTLGAGAETDIEIKKPIQAAVGITPPTISLSTQWTGTARAHSAGFTGQGLAIACNGSIYVAFGTSGSLMSSTDGIAWTDRTSADAGASVGWVTWGAGLFVAVKSTNVAGEVMTSPDGITWTDRTATSIVIGSPMGVTYGHAGFLIALNSSGALILATSQDGITWTQQPTPASFRVDANLGSESITYGNGKYVICRSTTGFADIILSEDLATFTEYRSSIGNSPGQATGLCYGNGVYILGGANGNYVKYSYDALSWTNTSIQSTALVTYDTIAYGGGHFLLCSQLLLWTSPDGQNWTSRTSAFVSNGVKDAIFGHTGFVTIRNGTAANNIETIPGAIRLEASVCGIDFASAGVYIAQHSAAVTVLNCDVDYGIDAIKDAQGFSVKNSVVRNIRANENIMAELSETVVTGNVELFKNYASTNDVNRNTIVGVYSDWDTTTTDIDQFRDNVIEGGIKSNRVLTVDSGNVRGYVSPSVTFATSMVSEVDPLFVTAGSDYRLATAADGTASPLLELSTFYDPDGTAGTGRDYGAYSFDYAGIATTWRMAIPLPRPVGVVSKDQIAGVYNRAIGGNQLGVNYTDAAAERIELNWNSLDAASYGQLKTAWRTIESCRARLTWNVDGTGSAFTVTADGGEATGSNKITIDASNNAPPGAKITIAGVDYFVLRISPPEGPATKLTLNKDLESTIANNDVLNVEQVAGNGEYTIIWPTVFDRNPLNSRMINDPQMAFRGCTIAFARAASASGVGE